MRMQGDQLPKVLQQVHGKCIIDYVMEFLQGQGIDSFIFPLGYAADNVQNHVAATYSDGVFHTVQTGLDTPIGVRVKQVLHLVNSDDFLLVNGDNLYDFDLKEMVNQHYSKKALVTITTGAIKLPYGLLIVNRGRGPASFVKGQLRGHINLEGDYQGFFNVGVTLINTDLVANKSVYAFDAADFEIELFNFAIGAGRLEQYHIYDNWLPIDTPKDLIKAEEWVKEHYGNGLFTRTFT